MNQGEYAELMQQTQAQMRRAGLDDLRGRISITLEAGEPPSRQLRRMLDALREELRHHDLLTTQRIMDEHAQTVRTETGEPPQGMWLDLSDAHQNLYGVDHVDLMQGVALTRTIEELRALSVELAEDPDTWR
jgi:hypothetical protein